MDCDLVGACHLRFGHVKNWCASPAAHGREGKWKAPIAIKYSTLSRCLIWAELQPYDRGGFLPCVYHGLLCKGCTRVASRDVVSFGLCSPNMHEENIIRCLRLVGNRSSSKAYLPLGVKGLLKWKYLHYFWHSQHVCTGCLLYWASTTWRSQVFSLDVIKIACEIYLRW